MKSDAHVTHVWFSAWSSVDFPPLMKAVRAVLKKNGIDVHDLSGTRDYFCRDYMPIEVDGKTLVQFTFAPAYLRAKRFLSDPAAVLAENGLGPVVPSTLVLDGGNVVKGDGWCLVTDRVCRDNPTRRPAAIQAELERLLAAEVLILPALPGEPTGHADGLFRFLGRKRILMHEEKGNDREWHRRATRLLLKKGFDLETLPFLDPATGKEGLHINFLEAGKVLLIPGSGGDLDDPILARFQKWFPRREVVMLPAAPLMRHEGAFNCFSWGTRVDWRRVGNLDTPR